jgi:DNA-binding NarL/FixJ family response regulator
MIIRLYATIFEVFLNSRLRGGCATRLELVEKILLDFQMPDLNGLDVARKIAQSFPDIPILMVTIHLSRQLADEARKAGIRGVCLKSDVGSIVEAVDTLLHQRTYFPQTAATSN